MATTLVEANQGLAIWQAALDAVATGQEYTVGSRRLSRTDASVCLKMVRYYESEVDRLTAGRGRGARVLRIRPNDF